LHNVLRIGQHLGKIIRQVDRHRLMLAFQKGLDLRYGILDKFVK
jgi:hypothetical protein